MIADRLRQAGNRLRAFFRKAPLDREMDAEIAAHIELAAEENLSQGLPAAEARRRALARFGGLQQARERQRAARGLPVVDALGQDLRYALRTLARDRGFTAVAVLILALGIGANVAVFSVVNTILLRPLPFRDAPRLAWIAPPPQKCGFSCSTVSADAYEEFAARTRSFTGVTGYNAFTSADNLRLARGGGAPVSATGVEVISNFFQVLGVQPRLGRLFTPEEARAGSHPVALLQYNYWKRQFGGDPNIVGSEIDLDGQPVTVLGVLPESFDFGAVFSPGSRVDVIEPLNLDNERQEGNIVTLIARLRPGVALGPAQADVNRVLPSLCWSAKAPQSCGSYAEGQAWQARSLKDYVSGRLRRSLIVLWAAVGVILLIACVNLANLLLARATARDKEFAMRAALGASRGRLLGQMLTECLLLSAAGAVLGLGLAGALVAWLARQASLALPLLGTLRMDPAALGWTVMIAIAAALLFGLLPGLRVARGNLQQALQASGHGASASRRHETVRSALAVAEVGLACMLLVGAGLMLRSFLKVLDVNLGFQPDRAASIQVVYSPLNDPQALKRLETFRGILSHVEALPGVEAAGIVDFLPLGQNRAWGAPVPQGVTYAKGKHPPSPLVYVATPGYIRAMGMRLRGRDFAWQDGPQAPEVVIINAAAARFYWPGQDALGQVLMRGSKPMRVIGVVDDVRASSVEHETGWQIYYSALQEYPEGAQLVIRSRMPPAALAPAVLGTLRQLNPEQPVEALTPIRDIVDRAVSPRRFFVLLVALFAALGLLLAGLGIYGVIAYGVTRRTREIGIRMALGASRGQVQRAVLSQTLSLVLAGVAAGTVASFIMARLIQSLLFAVEPTDAVTYAGTIALLILVAAAAAYFPARRAARVNPIIALRAN